MIENAYNIAKERYAELGVDTDKAIESLKSVSLSIHCWQGDDVGGFEKSDSTLSGGGIQVTGNYPGKARTVKELRSDLEAAYSLIPGNHRLNLHASYGEFNNKPVDRDAIEPEHFAGWVEWAKENNLKLDFNATCFSHPKADSGFTLSDYSSDVRSFWVEHVKRCREISAYMGKELGSPCIHNLWIPDGAKDITVDRLTPRQNLMDSLNQIYSVSYDDKLMKDAVECKLFGIGSESYVVGSHEFYMGYAMSKGLMVCLDLGHFHPTESVADKISALLPFYDEILLHVSRGIRWDSDHVVILNDAINDVMAEIVRCGALNRINLALDYFDASINRIGAWVIGSRSTLKGLLAALLEPNAVLVDAERNGKNFERLALLEEMKSMPAGAVWDYYCSQMDVPVGASWLSDVQKYEAAVTSKR
ncbi:MAG: L-rhamnose isomerase [Armatimonadota bacterium]